MTGVDGIRLHGVMADDARCLLRSDGSAEVHAHVRQADGGRDGALAIQVHGTSHAAQYAAQNSARRMRRGEPVTVHAKGWAIVSTHLVLIDVSLIECAAAHDHTAPAKEAA